MHHCINGASQIHAWEPPLALMEEHKENWVPRDVADFTSTGQKNTLATELSASLPLL